MARGSDFAGFVSGNYLTSGELPPQLPLTSIAELILTKNNIPFRNIAGSPLAGYDIKSQDSLTMIKLSLLADGTESGFPEIYTATDGVAVKVIAGLDIPNTGLEQCLLKTESANFVNRIDHVLVKGKDPLPFRYSKGEIDVMGAGTVFNKQFSCSTGLSTKNNALAQEAWAEFGRSLQSTPTQALLKAAVRRSQWENLIGYKVRFADIPSYAGISMSQTSPRDLDVPFSSDFNTVYTLNIGDTLPDGGGMVDVAGLSSAGAPVVDLAKGSDLRAAFEKTPLPAGITVSGDKTILNTPTLTVANLMDDSGQYDFNDSTYYCMLDHQCGVISISRGTNWFLTSAGGNNASLILRRSGSNLSSESAFTNFDSTVNYFRRKDGGIGGMKDYITSSLVTNKEIFDTQSGRARKASNRGTIVEGIGGSNGIELNSLELDYSVSSPSIAVKSPQGDAAAIAARLAANGVTYNPIVTSDPPAPTGWTTVIGIGIGGYPKSEVIYPVAPPDNENEAYKLESKIDQLEGTVMDIAAPYLGAAGVLKLSAKISTLINGDKGQTVTLTYRAGGYNLLPGMRIPEGVIQTLEFTYNDGESISTNITTGPLYYPVGSYGDSQYVKRSESFSRDAWVVAGDNASGSFMVDVVGLGRYEAINGDVQTIYPGDKVEVKLMNVPVELN